MIKMLKSNIKFCLILLFFIVKFELIYVFDYNFYVNKYPDVPDHIGAFLHYLNYGFHQGRQSAESIDNTNFDWKYYVKINNLDINDKDKAKEHYKTIGKYQGLKYCRNFKICITLHLYNLRLLNEFIEKINYFMKINKLNDFYIKINVPISKNIDAYADDLNLNKDLDFDDKIFNQILDLAPYHKDLINQQNYKTLYSIVSKLKNSFNIDKDNVQVIFSENRGADIGGFLLLCDQILKGNLDIDYIVVSHTKTHNIWREILTSILKLKVNNLLNYYKYIDACNFTELDPCTFPFFSETLDYFNLLCTNKLSFSLGTTFIASHELVDFFKPYDMLELFDQLSFGDAFHRKVDNIFFIGNKRGVTREHTYTRLLGYLISHLNLKPLIIDYIK